MASFSLCILALVVTYFFWNCHSWYKNYREARRSGLPLILCPVSTDNLLWAIFAVVSRPFLERYLPTFIFNSIVTGIYGWEFRYRSMPIELFGPAFILVTPGKNVALIADPEMIHSILTRRNDFTVDPTTASVIGMFGPNLFMSEGDDWVRQRKIISPLLNERIMDSVWQESSKQAGHLLDSFVKNGESNTAIPGLRSIAANVLGSVAYGAESLHEQTFSSVSSSHHISYVESVMTIVENLELSTFISPLLLTSPVMPSAIQKIGHAVRAFPKHARKMLESERASGVSTRNNLLSTLIRVSDAGSYDTEGTFTKKLYMTESELAGTLFSFTIAGFDTTANTLAYALVNLAAYPHWQTWIQEEFDQLRQEVLSNESSVYEKTFPKMKRTRALMYETLRLYTPLSHIPRATKGTAQPLKSGSKTYLVPRNSTIYLSTPCTHIMPEIWSSDALEFRPTRWLNAEGSIIHPARGTFTPWSAGPRNCPGQKMAEVEFAAVIKTLFSTHSVSLLLEPNETQEMAYERLKRIIADSQPRVTLQMNRPRDVKLRWEMR